MQKEKALKLIENLPQITPELERKCRHKLRYFILHDKKEAYCTACEESMDISRLNLQGHRKTNTCPLCKAEATEIDVKNSFCGGVIESQANVMVFLSSENTSNLYCRCFTLNLFFEHSKIVPKIKWSEVQAYVFTNKAAVRYGHNHYWIQRDDGFYSKCFDTDWAPRVKMTPPVFYNYSNQYVVNFDAISQTVLGQSGIMEYCKYCSYGFFEYYKFYKLEPGIERLSKSGLFTVAKRCLGWGVKNSGIDFAQNEPHKMMGVTKDVMRAIKDGQIELENYKRLHNDFEELNLQQIIVLNSLIGYGYGSLDCVIKATGLPIKKIIKYLIKQHATVNDYYDYLTFAKQLKLNVKDKAVYLPPSLTQAHDRLNAMRRAIEAEAQAKREKARNKKLKDLYKNRKKLEFETHSYMIRQPESAQEIINEGQALCHCVGGYADRHVDGKLTIMFLRRKSEPDKPYYTIEVSKDYKIVQCRGYKNNWVSNGGKEKSKEIIDIEKLYQNYLDTLKNKKEKKIA